MAVYNGEAFLREAIDSILEQTIRDFEFVIVDDGSTDRTAEIVRSYQDSRILLVQNEENIGLTRSLNAGIAISRGKYVARMDADDISMPERFQRQVEFLERNPGIGVCGTAMKVFGEGEQTWAHPLDSEAIKAAMIFNNALFHPTVMIRNEVLRRHDLMYDVTYRTSQDYDLWTRMAAHTEFANLGDVLVRYRRHSAAVGRRHIRNQTKASIRIKSRYIQQTLGFLPTLAEATLHDQISRLEFASVDGQAARAWLVKLLHHCEQHNVGMLPSVQKHVSNLLRLIALHDAGPIRRFWSILLTQLGRIRASAARWLGAN